MAEACCDQLTKFDEALVCPNDVNSADYKFFTSVAVSSLTVSNLRCLIIPGSNLNSLGLSCDSRLDDSHILLLTKAILVAGIQLENLSLCNHRISDKGLAFICSDIVASQKKERHLFHLNLEGNEICGLNISELLLSTEDCPLLSLNLSHNPLDLTAGIIIADGLRTNRNMQSLQLNNCGFDLSVIVAFGVTLRQNSFLKVLNLDRPLSDKTTSQEEGADHLSRLLARQSSCIEEMHFRYHGIADLGASLMAASLWKNNSLTYLDLERNRIGSAGCEALAAQFLPHKGIQCPLHTLLLSYNTVGNEGAKAMADAIQSSRVLKRLSLKSNGIQEGGLIVLAIALSSNKTLESIELFGNEFSDGTGQFFHDMKSQFSEKLSLDLEVYAVDGNVQIAELNV